MHKKGPVFRVTKTISITLSDRGIGLIVLPIANGIACVFALEKEILYGKKRRIILSTANKMRKLNKLLNLSMKKLKINNRII